MAVGGAVIGFNSLWQFPGLVAGHGGGAFLAIYVLALAVLGLPLIAAEMLLGQLGGLSPASTFARLALRARSDPIWVVVGFMAMAAGFLIFCFLSVIGAWAVAYLARALFGTLSGHTADGFGSLFTALVQDPEKQLFWFTLFVGVTVSVSMRGVQGGLERLVRIALPWLLGSLIALVVYAATLPAFAGSVKDLLAVDFMALGISDVLAAIGQVFFSLGLGSGAILMYGAYAPAEVSLPRATLAVAMLDTLVGMFAAVAVLTLLAQGGVDPASGPALVFQALPLAFDHLPLGRVLLPLFFVMLVAAALLAAVALIEPGIAWIKERFLWSRPRAALAVGVAGWFCGVVVMLSFNHWAFSFRFFDETRTLGLFDAAQILATNVLLPLAGAGIALFAGWHVERDLARARFGFLSPCTFDAWLWLTRAVVPLLLLALLFVLPGLFA